MMEKKTTTKIAVTALAAALLTATTLPVNASGQLPILRACLAEAKNAPDSKAARNQCIWHHWELMAEYD
jgi:hypothetical protein